MRVHTVTLLGIVICALMLAGIATGCASDTAEDGAATSEPDIQQPTDPPSEPADPQPQDSGVSAASPTEPARPSAAEAEEAVLAIARAQYLGVPTESVRLAGIGRDAQGRWWIQAWSSAGVEYEVEQWFVIYDGTSWVYHRSGTGLERSDLPGDIAWEDVP